MHSSTFAAMRHAHGAQPARERISEDCVGLSAYDLHLHQTRYRLAARVEQRGVVLDLGCGTCYGGDILSRAGVRVVGFDRATPGPTSSQLSAYWGIIKGDCLHLPFRTEAFATVVMLELIEHLDNPKRLLAEVSRVMRADGILVLSTPNRNGLTKILLKAIGWKNPFHLHEYTRAEMVSLLDEGFEVLDHRGVDFFKFGIDSVLSRSQFLSRVFVDDLARATMRISSTMFFVCRKR